MHEGWRERNMDSDCARTSLAERTMETIGEFFLLFLLHVEGGDWGGFWKEEERKD